ncbi:hypothetical protein HK107_06685 [Parvularcula sp. ZS-1/3]|uniref:Uncharacterized protein n=1 Tax=Parvularcula mediterranea TaxID=2732508 RepID=A0A7Y3RLW6_9PROT|nr:hypothetical protein [Parvularcula mediterranea]NNU16005.1 hypothetical protein [Parvularcula mediterranea]
MQVRTIGPVKTPLWLEYGHDPRSRAFDEVLAAMPPEGREFTAPNRADGARDANFSRSSKDDLDLRLFVWEADGKEGGTRLRLHVYPFGVSVLETFQVAPPLFPVETCEAAIQEEAMRAYEAAAPALLAMFRKIEKRLPKSSRKRIAPDYRPRASDIEWVARCVVLTKEEAANDKARGFIREWLAPTARPEEAEAIIAGDLDSSMTWLNYVVIEGDDAAIRDQFAAIRTAQAFYAAQSILNLDAQERLVARNDGVPTKRVEAELVDFRRKMQILRILFETQKGFLSRQRRAKFDDVLTLWDYDDLVDNGSRIISASTDRIGELLSKRSQSASLFTDFILFFIALFAIVEVTLYLTEYSREMMSRPALAFEDEDLSGALRFFASIDADWMIASAFGLAGTLVLGYLFLKRRF